VLAVHGTGGDGESAVVFFVYGRVVRGLSAGGGFRDRRCWDDAFRQHDPLASWRFRWGADGGNQIVAGSKEGLASAVQLAWAVLTNSQRRIALAVLFVVLLVAMSGWLAALRQGRETEALERQAAEAKRDALLNLEKAAEIARERAELERRILILEAKRDAKISELEKAAIEAADARLAYDRALRDRRGDEPDAIQLCTELAALGYACQ
jgi:hypothetical protein